MKDMVKEVLSQKIGMGFGYLELGTIFMTLEMVIFIVKISFIIDFKGLVCN